MWCGELGACMAASDPRAVLFEDDACNHVQTASCPTFSASLASKRQIKMVDFPNTTFRAQQWGSTTRPGPVQSPTATSSPIKHQQITSAIARAVAIPLAFFFSKGSSARSKIFQYDFLWRYFSARRQIVNRKTTADVVLMWIATLTRVK